MSSELAQLWKGAGGQVPPNADVVSFESLLAGPKAIAVGVMYPGEHCDDGVPLIKVGDINGGRIPAEPKFKVSQAVNTEYQRTQLRGDELLITLVGEPGACVVATSAMKGWNPARAIAVARLKDPSLRTYVKAVLESRPGKHLIDSVLNTTVQKTLNLKDIRQLPVPLPARSVVDAVSQVVDALDDRITLLRETNATLEAIAQAMFKSWFVDFDPVRAKMTGRAPEGMDEATAALFPDALEETTLGLVPKGWSVKTLADVTAYLNRGLSPKYVDDGGLLVLNQKCVRDFSIDWSKGRRHDPNQRKVDGRLLENGDVLVNSTGVGTLGRVGQILSLPEPAIVDSHVTVVRAGAAVSWPYLGQWVQSRQGQIEAMGEGSTGQTELSRSKLGSMPLLVPKGAVLAAFDAAVLPLKARISCNADTAQSLSMLRDTLLPRLISGQLRLPEAQVQARAQWEAAA